MSLALEAMTVRGGLGGVLFAAFTGKAILVMSAMAHMRSHLHQPDLSHIPIAHRPKEMATGDRGLAASESDLNPDGALSERPLPKRRLRSLKLRLDHYSRAAIRV